jgi:hypothetical protein
MDPNIQRTAAHIEDAADEIRRIAERLMTLSEEGAGRAMTHTEGVDCLISFVDRLDYGLLELEGETGSAEAALQAAAACSSMKPGDLSSQGALPGLCQDIRCKAADLDRLNRDGMGSSSEIGELAAELMHVEGELRATLVSLAQKPTG